MTPVRIIEVGPRDGLQNEVTPVSTETKLEFICALAAAGLQEIEISSFVSPKWVPQMADAAELFPQLPEGIRASALVPNVKGLERALSVGVSRIALFTAASDAFTQKNIAMSVEDSLAVFADVIAQFRAAQPHGFVRGYISTVVECPYAGPISPDRVAAVADRLLELGVNEISLGETIGVAIPAELKPLYAALSHIANDRIAWHFHDTRGTAIANVASALDHGYTAFDSSAAGLGGCPYAKGAGGNLATEDLIYFLERNGIQTGVSLMELALASLPVLQALGRSPSAKAQLAALAGG